MSTARFDVYGRYELDIERRGDRWVVYRRGEGRRREEPAVYVPPDVPEAGLAAFLDDLLHEEGRPGTTIARLR